MLRQLQEMGHVGRVEPDLAPAQAEALVDNIMEQRGEGVCDVLAKEVAVAVELCGLGGEGGVWEGGRGECHGEEVCEVCLLANGWCWWCCCFCCHWEVWLHDG